MLFCIVLIEDYPFQVGEAAAFIRSDDPALFPVDQFQNNVKDSTSGDDGPDLEIFFSPMAYKVCGRLTWGTFDSGAQTVNRDMVNLCSLCTPSRFMLVCCG